MQIDMLPLHVHLYCVGLKMKRLYKAGQKDAGRNSADGKKMARSTAYVHRA